MASSKTRSGARRRGGKSATVVRDDRRRPQDWNDIRALLAVAKPADLETARAALRLIEMRGFARQRKLLTVWKKTLVEFNVDFGDPF